MILASNNSSILQLFISNILTQIRIETDHFFLLIFSVNTQSSDLKAVRVNLTLNCLDNIVPNINSD